MSTHPLARRTWSALLGLLRGACLGLLGLSAGCGSSDFSPASAGPFDDGVPSPVLGGQTGSLVPRCGVAPLVAVGSVPEGDAVYVVYADECPEAISEGAFGLLDGEGRAVDVEYEELSEGVYLVRAPGGVVSGEYQVVLPGSDAAAGTAFLDASVDAEPDGGASDGGVSDGGTSVAETASSSGSSLSLRVGDAATPPSSLGTLSVDQTGCDTTTFRLQLGAGALPYAPLMQLVATVDGRLSRAWVDYGAIRLANGATSLPLNACDFTPCLGVGSHSLTVTATIAGYAERPTASSDFRVACASSSTSSMSPPRQRGFLSCGISAERRTPAPTAALGLACALLLAGAARPRRRRPR